MFLYHIELTVSRTVSEPQTAGNVQPQGWVILVVLLIATVIWFFTRNKRS